MCTRVGASSIDAEADWLTCALIDESIASHEECCESTNRARRRQIANEPSTSTVQHAQ
jgi:hypothetical protein